MVLETKIWCSIQNYGVSESQSNIVLKRNTDEAENAMLIPFCQFNEPLLHVEVYISLQSRASYATYHSSCLYFS
jgi:hypothetical protein